MIASADCSYLYFREETRHKSSFFLGVLGFVTAFLAIITDFQVCNNQHNMSTSLGVDNTWYAGAQTMNLNVGPIWSNTSAQQMIGEFNTSSYSQSNDIFADGAWVSQDGTSYVQVPGSGQSLNDSIDCETARPRVR